MEWKPIATAPRNAQVISVRMKDGTVHWKAHFASDKTGEDQPPFEGWFIEGGLHWFKQIDEPVEWMPIIHAAGREEGQA